MDERSVRTDEDIEETIHSYADMLYRICITMLKNPHDAEDVVQETFIGYYQNNRSFDSDEHKKAWLITVAVNKCKNLIGFFKRHDHISIDDIQEFAGVCCDDEERGLLEELMKLPPKQRIVMELYYVEEYKIKEIADMLAVKEPAVKMRLQKGRSILKEIYREEYAT